MQEELEVDAGRTQSLFRAVNERIGLANLGFDEITETRPCVCECARLGCIDQIEVSPAEYSAVRENPRRFLVIGSPAHVLTRIENVVERYESYWVVEKIGAAAEEAVAQQRHFARS